MKLIVGLGNPGAKYNQTRHNVGFDVIAELARRHPPSIARERFQANVAETTIEGEKVLLIRPLTFMNLSGESVQTAKDFYKLENAELIVACDDFALELGKLRLRAKGSSGGQKGLANIIQRLGTEEFPRLRVGIGPIPEGWDAIGFVLGKFSKDEQSRVEETIKRAADAVAAWIKVGLSKAMSQYNA